MKKIFIILPIILILIFTYRYYYSNSNYIIVYPLLKNYYHTPLSHEEFPDGIISPVKLKKVEKEIKNYVNKNQEVFKEGSQGFEFDIEKLKIISIDSDNNKDFVLVTMGIIDEQILFYFENNKVVNFEIED